MDYSGQRLAEYIYAFLTILCGAIGWIVGYSEGNFMTTVYGWAIGLGLSLLICIPDWPIFNRKKVIWLDEVGKVNKLKDKDSTKVKKTKKVEGKSS